MTDFSDKPTVPEGDDPLDQLLKEARWPEASPKAQARLANRWQDAWSAQRRWERLAQRSLVVSLAACFLVAAVLGWGWRHRGHGPVAQPNTAQRSRPRTDQEKVTPVVKESRVPRTALRPLSTRPPDQKMARSLEHSMQTTSADGSDEKILSRPPNKLEELLIAAWDIPPRVPHKPARGPATQPVQSREQPALTASATGTTKSAKSVAVQDVVGQAVARLVADPKADPAVTAAELQQATTDSEMRLLAILGDAAAPEQAAAIRLLGELGTSASVPELLRLAGDKSLHAVALGALSRIADPQTIDQLVREEASTELRRVLLAALLGRGEPSSLSIYLSYVASKEFGPTALAATELVSHPPMDRLFSALGSTSEFDRLAAARVLGRIDGPETTQRLITLLEQGQSRQEACVALLTSRGEEAASFVSSARTNPTLATLLQAASVLISHDPQPRS